MTHTYLTKARPGLVGEYSCRSGKCQSMRPDFSCPHGGADGTRAKAGPAAGPSIAHAQLTLALRKGIREGVAAAVRPSDSVTDAERIEQAGARLRLRSLLDAEHTAAREAMALAQALGESW